MPSPDAGDRPEPRLDGANEGDGLNGVTGDDEKLPPAPIGEGGTREDDGDCIGREGSDGPPVESGECCLRDGEGECSEGDPDEIVDDLNALTVVMGVRRMGTPPGVVPSSYEDKSVHAHTSTSNALRTELRPCKLSRRTRAASADTSSRDPSEAAPCLDENESDTPEVPIPAPERLRVTGSGMFPRRGLPLGLPFTPCWDEKDVVRVCVAGGRTKRSAIDRGGERGNDVRSGGVPGVPDRLSRCWFFTSVGVKSGPSERKREDKRDSRVSSWNVGCVRYVADTCSSPMGCVIGGSTWLSCCSTDRRDAGELSGFRSFA